MRVRWTTDAADDLERICDYIAESRPASARKVAKTIVDGVGILEVFIAGKSTADAMKSDVIDTLIDPLPRNPSRSSSLVPSRLLGFRPR